MLCFLASCHSEVPAKDPLKDVPKEVEFQIPAGAFPIVYHRGRICIEGSVDSVKCNFLFDTGADNIYFDSLFFSENSFSYDNVAIAFLPGFGVNPKKVKLIMDTVSFHFGNNLYKANMAPIFELRPITGDFVDGIIGKSYFSEKVLEINFQYQYMKTYDSIQPEQLIGYSKIQCENINNRLFVPLKLQINDSIIIEDQFLLDMGGAGTLELTNPTAMQYDLNNKIENKVKYYNKYGGVGGESVRSKLMSEKVTIGDYQLNNFIMSYSEDNKGSGSSKHTGFLFNGILERFDLLVDFKNSCLYLKPNADYKHPFEILRRGFSFVDRTKTYGAWNVTGFFVGSSAEKSGLKIDDKITHLNGISVLDINDDQQEEIFRNAKSIELTVKRDSEILMFDIELKEIIDALNY